MSLNCHFPSGERHAPCGSVWWPMFSGAISCAENHASAQSPPRAVPSSPATPYNPPRCTSCADTRPGGMLNQLRDNAGVSFLHSHRRQHTASRPRDSDFNSGEYEIPGAFWPRPACRMWLPSVLLEAGPWYVGMSPDA
jgi:hypothetical protein